MDRIETFAHKFVELMPNELKSGVIYISRPYELAIHLCACGCGGQVVMSFRPGGWKMTDHGDTISLSPSVGNQKFECRSHYWIRKSQVVWA